MMLQFYLAAFAFIFFFARPASADWCIWGCKYEVTADIGLSRPVKSLDGLSAELGACLSTTGAGQNAKENLYEQDIEPAVRKRYRYLKELFNVETQFDAKTGKVTYKDPKTGKVMDRTPISGKVVKGKFVPDDPVAYKKRQANLRYYRQTMFMKDVDGTGVEVTEDEFVAMDALARTLVGEMGTTRCQPHDVYMSAVAKVVLNRSQAVMHSLPSKARFCVNEKDNCEKGDTFTTRIKAVVMAKKQFSMWNKMSETPRSERRAQASLQRRAYCPKKGSTAQTEVWKWAARVAMLTVLAPKKLADRTKGLDQFYYTSNIAFKYGVETGDPVVNGETVDNNSCLRFWNERLGGKSKAVAKKVIPKKNAPVRKVAAKPAVKKSVPKKKPTK